MIKRNQIAYYVHDNHPVIMIPGRVSEFYLGGKYCRFIDSHNMDRILPTKDILPINYKGYWRSKYRGNDIYDYYWIPMMTMRKLKKQWGVKQFGFYDQEEIYREIMRLENEDVSMG